MRFIAYLVSAGSGAAKVSSRGPRRPNAPRAFADPLASLCAVMLLVLINTRFTHAGELRSLFDGASLAGWDVREGEAKCWNAADGMIVGG